MLALGLRHRSGAHLWLQNRTWTPEALIGLVTTALARDVAVTVTGLRDGPARVEWTDPMTGEPVAVEDVTVVGGTLALRPGDIPRDRACRIRYR